MIVAAPIERDEMQVADRLANVRVGLYVHVFDAQATRRENGEYKGRGVFRDPPAQITSETRDFWNIDGAYGRAQYRKDTGSERSKGGYAAQIRIMGWHDRADFEWMRDHRRAVLDAVADADATKLRRIANLIGYDR